MRRGRVILKKSLFGDKHMCNIAGYVGQRRAAPILIDMIRRQEGLAGGYYTGIATIHEGRIYYAKLTGYTDRLVSLTEAADLPGNIGIIHTRSKSGGGDRWAHPFVSRQGGEIKLAYVANGSAGCFGIDDEQYIALARGLEESGFVMESKDSVERRGYATLPDGQTAHMSDVMCQLIAREYDKGVEGAQAMAEAFCRMPNEIVGLALFADEPDRISWSRINMPMSVAFCDHGAYLATAPCAFPADAGAHTQLPACSSGHVTAESFGAVPYKKAPCKVASTTAGVVSRAYEVICRELGEGERTRAQLKRAIKSCFESADCDGAAALAYEIIYDLQKCGKLNTEVRRVEGAAEGIDALKFYMRLK